MDNYGNSNTKLCIDADGEINDIRDVRVIQFLTVSIDMARLMETLMVCNFFKQYQYKLRTNHYKKELIINSYKVKLNIQLAYGVNWAVRIEKVQFSIV